MLYIPLIIEKEGRNDKHYDIFSRLLKDYIITLTGEITDDTATVITAELLFLYYEDPDREISLYINSPGGSVTAGLAIYDMMQFIKNPIKTVVMGEASSMGSFLAAGGTKGLRLSMPNARFMYHQVLGGAYGQASDIEITANEIILLKNKLNKMLSNNTYGVVSYEEMTKLTDRDKYMSPEEAKEKGFLDGIIGE